METRHKIELGVAILVILGFIALLVFLLRKEPDAVVVVDDGGQEQLDDAGDRPSKPVTKVDPEDIPTTTQVSATTIARTFVERFGSYSSETDFANVEDLLTLATDDFREELEDIVRKARKNSGSAYYGISTIVISTKVVTQSDVATTLRIVTQREEAIDDPANATVRYQEIVVDLVKDGDSWLIDGFTWQES